MLLDFRTLDANVDLTSDVCIVGAGAAGLTLARGLLERGRRVTILESGGLDFDAATQDLYAGSNLGCEYYPLVDSRLRFFGGTTNIWGGRCAVLDAIDFEQRDWVAHSGWPIGSAELEPWYRRAHDALELGAFDYGPALWQQVERAAPDFDPGQLAVSLWRFDEVAERFAHSRMRDVLDNPRLTVCLHANLVKIRASDNASGIECLHARALGGAVRDVRATHYVLACGGIENARMLLASQDVEPAGIGNRHDQVGRYFMEHPHGRAGRIDGPNAYRLWSAFRKRYPADSVPIAPVLRLSEAAQRAHGVLNSAVTFKLQRDPSRGEPLAQKLYQHLKHSIEPTRSGRQAHHLLRALRKWAHVSVRSSLLRARARAGTVGLQVLVRGEQAPNPLSRVLLSDTRDALGVPRANLDWRLEALDRRTVLILGQVLDTELRRLGLGTLQRSEWLDQDSACWPVDPTIGNHPIGGYHHMGTTRMSAAPQQGVVDAECRVHGYGNLWIAGSSVFPTAGWANPTLTILALAHRLAARVDTELSG